MKNRVVTGKPGGFTLIELLVVIAIIAILASMILPALSTAKLKSQQIKDLNNLRQLSISWTLYAGDNRDRLVYNYLSGANMTNSWINASIASLGASLYGATNEVSIKTGKLYIYNPNAQIYQCPSATTGNDVSKGKRLARNYSMEGRMNSDQGSGIYTLGVYKTISSIPKPAQSILFVDESTLSIDDGVFAVQKPPSTDIQNVPTGRHLRSGSFSFADGHSDKKKWKLLDRDLYFRDTAATALLKPDLNWMQYHVYTEL
jgi:prepilin-type N-terminal cleavage/methylation domain-containing protein